MTCKKIIYAIVTKKKNLTTELLAQKLLEKIDLPEESLKKNPLGKPYLPNAYTLGWDISLAHSQDYFAAAIGKDMRIGIDCEIIQPIDLTKALLNLVLCPEEVIYESNTKQKIERFYEIWTCKEAISKALGLGLWLPFHQLNLEDPSKSLKKLFLLETQQHIKYEIIVSTSNLKVAFAAISNTDLPCEVVLCHDSLY